jgi:hypothetical protein
MATATAYRNLPESESGKLSPLALERIEASNLKPGVARTLRYLVIRSQYGPDLWAPTFKVSVDAGFHYRTVQRHIDKLERLKVLKLKHSANTHVNGKIRRSATYVLHPESAKHLTPRQNFEQWKKCNGRETPLRFRPQAAAPITPIAAPTADQRPHFPSDDVKSRKLTRDEKSALVRRVVSLTRVAPTQSQPVPPPEVESESNWSRVLKVLEHKINRHSFETWMRPTRGHHEVGGVLYVSVPTPDFLHIGDKHKLLLADALRELRMPYSAVQFIAPEQVKAQPAMSKRAALAQACQELSTPQRRISIEDGIVALRLAGYWNFEDADKGP